MDYSDRTKRWWIHLGSHVGGLSRTGSRQREGGASLSRTPPTWRRVGGPGAFPSFLLPPTKNPTTTAERAQWFPSEGGDRRGGDAATIDVLRFESEPSQKATNDVNWFRWEDETGEGAHNVYVEMPPRNFL